VGGIDVDRRPTLLFPTNRSEIASTSNNFCSGVREQGDFAIEERYAPVDRRSSHHSRYVCYSGYAIESKENTIPLSVSIPEINPLLIKDSVASQASASDISIPLVSWAIDRAFL
jgi:hypothetical protein